MRRSTALAALLMTLPILHAACAPPPVHGVRPVRVLPNALRPVAASIPPSSPRAGRSPEWPLRLAGDSTRQCPMPVSREGALRPAPMPTVQASARTAPMPVARAACTNPLAR